MSKIEDLKQTYIKDADMMASKPRFGYFSIPPTATAGDNAFEVKKIVKDQNGKIKTQQRNIFSGITASGVLKKSFFKYETSVYQGDLYTDPGKKYRLEKLEESKRLAEKDVYKPLNLVNTPEAKSSYEHVPQKPVKKNVKDYVDENGKVKTQSRNILTNSFSNIEKQKNKQFKYIPDPYQNNLKVQSEEHKKEIALRGQAPFKLSSSTKPQFYTNKQTYGTDSACLVKKQRKIKLNLTTDHDSNFKPSCSSKFDTFSYPQYIPGGMKPASKTTRPDPSKQSFKLADPYQKSKPCPSISTLKTNLLRCIR